jgi:hypothetical protein
MVACVNTRLRKEAGDVFSMVLGECQTYFWMLQRLSMERKVHSVAIH